MKASIVKIGNSMAIQIPRSILKQCDLKDEVRMEVHDRELVIRPNRQPREGWAEAFLKMANHGDDALLDPSAKANSSWDENEWEWK